MFKHEKGYSYINNPSITSVMHLKVGHSKINVTLHNCNLSGIIIRVICSKTGVLCACILIVCLLIGI